MKFFPPLLFVLCGGVAAVRAQTVTITPSASTYAANGGSVTFTVELNYSGPMSAIGFEVGNVPAGWSMGTVSGVNPPQIAARPGDTQSFSFAYTSIPPAPISFTFTATYAGGLTGNQLLQNISANFRSGTTSTAIVPAPNLVFTPATPPAGGNPPAITVQPLGGTVDVGGSITLSVGASGTAPLNYQWFKDGANLAAATNASLTLSAVTPASAGNYTVSVANAAGSVVSSAATVVVRAASTAPQIATQPVAQSAALGGTVTFSVVASGTAPLSYQWRKDGATISGATNASLTLTNVQTASAGNYSVAVSNPAGSATSNAVALTLLPAGTASVTGAYFGGFASNAGTCALFVRADRTGVFLGYVNAGQTALVARDVVVDAAGHFRITASVPTSTAASAMGARAANDNVVDGTIAADGTVTGSVSALGLTFSTSAPVKAGVSSAFTGFYQAGAMASSATCYSIIGPGGDDYTVATAGGIADAGRGTIDATGRIDLTTARGARGLGTVSTSATMALNITPASGAAINFIGANNDVRTDNEKLVNISTRSQTGGAGATLIAGFVITGDQPKPVLVRAVGPALANFGVTNPLSAARLQIFRGDAVIATGDDWGAAANASAIAGTADRVGAFPLPVASHDAALLLTLDPGAYTAIVSGQGGATGVSLIEVYDATAGTIPRTQRLINISTRAMAGAGDNALIAGLVITGTVPKRVLVRAAGPALAQFGVAGVLARPQLAVFSGATVLAQNSGWSSSPDAAAIADASARVGAFAFTAGSDDAALLIYLAPGPYTMQVNGIAGASGVALIEVYEFP